MTREYCYKVRKHVTIKKGKCEFPVKHTKRACKHCAKNVKNQERHHTFPSGKMVVVS